MSLIQCPECKKKISDTVRTCPNCGFFLTSELVNQLKEKTKNDNINGGIGCLVVLVLFFIFYKGCDNSSTEKTSPSYDKVEAYVAAKMFVENKLVSPSTADFPESLIYEHTTYLGDEKYSITSYVDSQNRFGATIRTNFKVKVKKLNGQWELIDIQLYE